MLREEFALVSAIVNLFFAIFVIIKGRQKRVKTGFFFVSMTIFVWSITFFLSPKNEFDVFDRIMYVGVTFIPFSALMFVRAITYPFKFGLIQKVFFVISSGLSILSLTGHFINPHELSGSPKNLAMGIILVIYVLVAIALCIFLLYHKHRKTTSPFERNRLRYVTITAVIMAVGGLTDFQHLFLGITGYEAGHLTATIYTFLMANIILKFRMVEISVLMKRLIVLSILVIAVLGIFLLTIYRTGNALMSLLVVVPTAFIMSIFVFRFTYQRFSIFVERLFFRPLYYQRTILEKFSKETAVLLSRKELIDAYVRTLQKVIAVNEYVLYIQKTETILERAAVQAKTKVPGLVDLPALKILDLLKATKDAFTIEELSLFLEDVDTDQASRDFIVALLDGMNKHKMEIIVKFSHHHRNAVLGLGRKGNGYNYTDDDVDFLTSLGSQFLMAFDNIDSVERIGEMERLSYIGQMSSSMAHEIRNPLSTIKMALNRIAKNKEPSENYISMALTEIDRVDKIITDLLDFSKNLKPELQLNDLAELLEKILLSIENSKSIRIRKLTRNLSKSCVAVVEPEYIHQILMNIIDNASQVTGGNVDVTVTLQRVPNHVQISISDNGPGIPAKIIRDIFTPFFTTRTTGTGLGLSIVKKLIEAQNGFIDVKSEEGSGAEFIVSFPSVDPKPVAARETRSG